MGLCTSLCKRNEDLQFTDTQREGRQDALEEIPPTEEHVYINLQWDGRQDIPEEITTISKEDELYNGFKEDLITHYRQNESEIVAVPLVDEHKVPIEALYVLPPLWVYDNPCNFSKNMQKGDKTLGNDTQLREQMWGNDALKRKRATVSQLFVGDDNVRYKKIYVTANAGFGKSSLSQKLTMTWCQTHSPLESVKEKYKNTELEAMKYFDLLFLLHLRDYQSEPQCNLDDLVMKMISTYMSRKLLYTNEFIERILHEKKCLVILDGLDEWSHPGHCGRKPEVPHNNHPDSCTVLTTTRDWKIGTIGLSPNHIDRRVEISEFDWLTRWSLETNAIWILNENNLNLEGKDKSDFDNELSSVQIGDIALIPFILLQLVFLFFGGHPIGTSKCEIYSNITEFTIERGLNKKNLTDLHEASNDNPVPNCMQNNKTCKRFINLIIKLGKLAFFTLFSEKKESSLTFDSEILTQYMISEEIEFCLKVELLNQTKDSSIIAVKRYKVFFQHKSVQEFFSAIYITSEWRKELVKSTVLKACSSLTTVLEMSNVFIFVCGMNPEVYTCISDELQKVVESDSFTSRYRTGLYISYDDTETIKSYQKMQMQCFQESVRNGNERCSVFLQDILLVRYRLSEDELLVLKSIIHFNKGEVKSLQLLLCKELDVFMLSLDSGIFASLETLRVECYEEPVWLANILTESTRTLKCLKISGISTTLSDICIKALTGLTNLNLLYLHYVTMTHGNLEHLNAYIRQTTTLTQLKLEKISCSIHNVEFLDCVTTLDLRRLNQLKILDLDQVPCRELRVSPVCLEKLVFTPPGTQLTASASSLLWEDLRGAPVLSLLDLNNISSCQEMFQTIPTLTQLQYLELSGIDMDSGTPDFVSAMTHLKHVGLNTVAMSFSKWKQLLISISGLPHAVTVDIQFCQGPSVEEWKTIVDVINSTPLLSLIQDLNIDSLSIASLTLEKI